MWRYGGAELSKRANKVEEEEEGEEDEDVVEDDGAPALLCG